MLFCLYDLNCEDDYVIDGDTFVISSGERVRIIGIDTPEVTGPYTKAEFYGKQASTYTKFVLVGTIVYLHKDVSEADRYNRLLRYVYLEAGIFFNLLLIQAGYVEAVQIYVGKCWCMENNIMQQRGRIVIMNGWALGAFALLKFVEPLQKALNMLHA